MEKIEAAFTFLFSAILLVFISILVYQLLLIRKSLTCTALKRFSKIKNLLLCKNTEI